MASGVVIGCVGSDTKIPTLSEMRGCPRVLFLGGISGSILGYHHVYALKIFVRKLHSYALGKIPPETAMTVSSGNGTVAAQKWLGYSLGN